jgi:CRP-like cAMP-binding protein
VRQGEIGDKFYIIVSGTAEVLLNRPGGGRVMVDRRREGEYFGEMALLGDGRRSATVRAALDGELTLVALDKQSFDHLINESRPLREELGRIVSRHRDRLEEHG